LGGGGIADDHSADFTPPSDAIGESAKMQAEA
jgi:hypothetical protein